MERILLAQEEEGTMVDWVKGQQAFTTSTRKNTGLSTRRPDIERSRLLSSVCHVSFINLFM